MATQSDKHRRHGHSRHGKQKDKHAHESTGLSFLFVVNELPIATYDADNWGNIIPPATQDAFYDEIPGKVFRYRNGTVNEATGYRWARPGRGYAGSIVVDSVDDQNTPTVYSLDEYRTYTIFKCWKFLPYVVTPVDASVGDMRNNTPPNQRWWALQFNHETAVTQVVAGGGQQYVAGKRPSWIPGILPDIYKNPHSGAQQSRGLGGELPIVIGLMALTQPVHRVDRAFDRGYWASNRWNAESGPWNPGPEDLPRGVIVHVALDNFGNPNYSTSEHLEHFEWREVAVRES